MTRALASSFADSVDLAAFKKCKARGHPDTFCFRVGDNGIGLWGDSTVAGTGPACALPSHIWLPFYYIARKKKVLVKHGKKVVTCELRDTLPNTSGRIDLNPDACESLGLMPPVLAAVLWGWV